MPRETESNLQTWNFDPIPSESRNWLAENLQGRNLKNSQTWCSAVTDASFHCQRVHQKDQLEDVQMCRFLIAPKQFNNSCNAFPEQPERYITLYQLQGPVKSRSDLHETTRAITCMNWGSRSKSTSKIKRLGRSVSQRRMPRETEKPPLTMIDEKPTDGTSTSEKDHDGHGMMKSANFKRVPNPDNEFDIFLSTWSWSDEWFFSWQSFLDRVFFGVRTHVVATTVCTTGSVHALTCCTHSFLSTARSLCTHTSCGCHIHAWLKVMKKGSLHMCHISPSRLLQSHVSPILAVPWRSLRDHSWLWRPHVLAVLTCPESAGHAHFRTSSEKFGYLAKSALDTGYEPKKFVKITSVDSDTVLIDDPDVYQISDFSKNTRENTGLFGVLTMFESSVSHVSQSYFCIQVESKESMHRETDCWTERKREKERKEGRKEKVLWSVL